MKAPPSAVPRAAADVSAAESLAPRRLLDGGGDAFERLLIESSQDVSVPQASLDRLARALQLPPEALPLPPPDAQSTTPGSAATGEGSWLARNASRLRLGAAGVVAIGVGLAALRPGLGGHEAPARDREEPAMTAPAAAASSPSSPEPEAPSPPALDSSVTPALAPAARENAPAARESLQPRRPAHRAASGSPSTSSTPSTPQPSLGLGAELRALEVVQHALWERRPEAAARALADYERRFAEGELGLEAELLGVEVALASGRREQAHARALELSARPAAARYRERLATLLDASENKEPATPARGANPRALHISVAEDQP